MCLGNEQEERNGFNPIAQLELHNFFSQGFAGEVTVQLSTTAPQKQVSSNKKFGTEGSIIHGRYTIMKTLGEGAQGKVKLAHDSLTNREVAIKFCSISRNYDLIKKEVQLLQAAQGHKNVLGLIEAFEVENYFLIVLERLSCDLFDVIDEAEYLPVDLAKKVLKELLHSLNHCHKNGVAHRDVKPENILLTSTNMQEAEIKLCDFGLASNQSGMCKTVCGSEAYGAPEVLDEVDYEGAPVDMWATGIVMYNIITSFSPWGAAVLSDDVFNKYVYSSAEFWAWTRKWAPVEITPEFQDLFSRLCHPNPKERITAQQALEHPFFA